MFDLKGKVALITGSGRGIGRSIAEVFAAQGAKVVVTSTSDTCKKVCEELVKAGAEAIAVKCDVTKKSDLENLLAETNKAFGPVDILVNNAGITKDARLVKMSEAEWDAVLTTNLKSVFEFCQMVAPQMMERNSGRIINISSLAGVKGNFGQANYSAAKGGLISMTKTIAIELGKYNVTANCIAPGVIMTDILSTVPEKVLDGMKSRIPLQRIGQPEDIAAAAVYLASDEASFVTGVTIQVNGGMYFGG